MILIFLDNILTILCCSYIVHTCYCFHWLFIKYRFLCQLIWILFFQCLVAMSASTTACWHWLLIRFIIWWLRFLSLTNNSCRLFFWNYTFWRHRFALSILRSFFLDFTFSFHINSISTSTWCVIFYLFSLSIWTTVFFDVLFKLCGWFS